jgi:hypothetical protein
LRLLTSRDAGLDGVELHLGHRFGVETAALLDPYTIAGKRDAGREGSWVAQKVPTCWTR